MKARERLEDSAARERAHQLLHAMRSSGFAPTLDGPGGEAVEAWFLGTRAENLDLFERLVVEALRDHGYWRRNFHPNDPGHITQRMRRTPQFLDSVDRLESAFRELLAGLKKSVPWFSMRYQGHMNWEVLLPAMLGYFATMLYNPNNVALEASPVTSQLERQVALDLCRLLGWEETAKVPPWGHVTCDGTVANIEAMWAARNLKFYPFALRQAAEDLGIRGIEVTYTRTKMDLLDCDAWQLANLDPDEILTLAAQLRTAAGAKAAQFDSALAKAGLQEVGIAAFSRRHMNGLGDPVILVPGTRHYSFPKAAALLGLGGEQLVEVPVDVNARMDPEALVQRLSQCMKDHRPVIAVVAVIGSTEESAVDPLQTILNIRDECRASGLDFVVHADAAWGGYFRSLLVTATPPGAAAAAPGGRARMPLSSYTHAQLKALCGADSVTIDPHKSGYVGYPAGALCYRNRAMRDLVSFSAPVIHHSGEDLDLSVGHFGVEGSKPGASPAAVYLAHRVVRPDDGGYGRILREAAYSAKQLCARLSLVGSSVAKGHVRLELLPRLPDDLNPHQSFEGDDAIAQRDARRARLDWIATHPVETLDDDDFRALREIGPDLNILAYAFNFKLKDGTWNTDASDANKYNTAIYNRLSVRPGQDIAGHPLIVSTTDLLREDYGDALMDSFASRLGLAGHPSKITVLRSVVMDPWVAVSSDYNFVKIVVDALCDAAAAEFHG